MRSRRPDALSTDPLDRLGSVIRPRANRDSMVRAGLCPLTRRQWLGIGLAGVGALMLPSSRADEPRKGPPVAKGRIFTTANLGAKDDGKTELTSLIAIDPDTGDQETVVDGVGMRPRVSPDGRTVAFERGDALWTRSVAGGDEPKQILDTEGATAASPPVWSLDGKQIVISLGTSEKLGSPWVFKTVRINADGTGRTELKVPPEDGVHDWSADGEWLLTASSRNAKIGWQLYVMRPDGTGQRQLTEGGNPFYARFAPDGRRLLYADGTTEERRGIWVVGLDGKGRRRVFATGDAVASACWSPDGKRIAVVLRPINVNLGGQNLSRIEVMDQDGENRSIIPLPEGSSGDMPDWR
jgi:Tol biopolymer transport system component